MGLLDRETGKVRVKHVSNRRRGTLQEEVRANVKAGASIKMAVIKVNLTILFFIGFS